MDLSNKDIASIAVSSLLAAVIGYYFTPGGGTLNTALWYALSNALIDIAALAIVELFLAK